jgi:protein O-mannosyl-transferase
LHLSTSRTRYLLALVILVATLPYASALRLGFIYDDHLQIEENPYLRVWPGIARVFSSDVWSMTSMDATSNYYRPLMWISYKLVFSLTGSSPWPFHLLNLLLHAGVTAILFLLTLRLWNDFRVAALSGLLFAIHPAHIEPVVWIAALPELGYTFFFLLAVYFYVGKSRLFLACYAISLLWKESALMFLPMVFLYDLILARQLRLRRYAAVAVVTSIYLALRYVALGGLAPHVVRSSVPVFAQFLTSAANIATYLTKLVFPLHLSFYYPVTSVTALNISIIAVAVLMLAAAFTLRGRAAWSALWIIVALVPTLAATRVVVPVAERNLYLASVGFVWLAAELLVRLKPGMAVAAMIVLLTAGVAIDIRRVPDWRDELILWEQALRNYPDDALIHLNVASELGRRHRYDDALQHLDQLLKQDPADIEALTSKAGILVLTEDWPAAAGTCARVFAIDPDSARCSLTMGIVAHENRQLEQAKEHFQRAYRSNPLLWQALFHEANLAAETGNLAEAIRSFERVLQRNPAASVFNNLGSAYAEMGQTESAIEAFNTALRIDPSFDMARQNLLRAGKPAKPEND